MSFCLQIFLMFNWLFGKSEPPKKTSTVKQDQKRWMYEALLQFLVSKQWKITILNFVDNNCIVFDNEEQNKFEYTAIHNRFKQLIAGMFDSMMNQLGLNQELLIELIQKGLKSSNAKIFEQLMYIDDFMKFKAMMLKRNAKLEKEALEQITQGKGNINKSKLFNQANTSLGQVQTDFIASHQSKNGSSQESQQEIMKRVMDMSLREEQQRKIKNQQLERQEQKNIALIKKQSQIKRKAQIQKQQQQKRARKLLEERAIKEKEMEQKEKKLRILKQKKDKLQENRRSEESRLLEEQRLQRQKDKQKEESEKKIKQQEKNLNENTKQEERRESVPETQNIQERKRRLLEQREILRKKKIQQRNQDLQKNQKKQAVKEGLIQVQTILLSQSGIHQSSLRNNQKQQQQEKVPQSEIERRRELMKKIKNKIVEDY